MAIDDKCTGQATDRPATERGRPPFRMGVVALLLGVAFAAGACSDDESDGSATTDTGDTGGTDLSGDSGGEDLGETDLAPDATADAEPDAEPDAAPDAEPDATADAEPDQDAGPTFACDNAEALRQPFFGETHVHTWYSFDSYLLGNYCNGPAEAFAFARGATQTLAPFDDDCNSIRETPGWDEITLRRPLDFSTVTDHSEFLGEMSICTDEGENGYNSAACETIRTAAFGETDDERRTAGQLASVFFVDVLSSSEPTQLDFCENRGVDCEAASADAWSRVQDAANEAYEPCAFTSFIGYEYTGIPGNSMIHRNILFRTGEVPAQPVTYVDAPDPADLWAQLVADCIEADDIDCDALAIPHNPNYSTGQLFGDISGAESDVMTRAEAELRARVEPLVEVSQVKGTSECSGAYSTDELCNFEITEQRAVCTGEDDPEGCVPPCPNGFGVDCSSPYDYIRGALGLGLVVEEASGANPYRLGFVGGTDSHNATPGATDEDFFPGHSGVIDQTPETALDATPEDDNLDAVTFAPGGLAVVWAEENTRDSIFAAMRRRETYATSGNRPVVRVFGGSGLDTGMCAGDDFVAQGYANGVPMGGVLEGRDTPRFAVWALADPDICPAGETCAEQLTTANYLQRVQIVKGWLDDEGEPQEQVWDIACANGAPVDGRCPDFGDDLIDDATCELDRGAGAADLCTVWSDPDFDADQRAFYYVRVIENPVCRWSTYLCDAEGVDCSAPESVPEGFEGCCLVPRTIQERAWTSPIWYSP